MSSPKPDISIRLEVLPGASVGEQIANARSYGFDAIALPGRFKDRWEGPLKECFADLPLPLASISLGFERSLLSPDESAREHCRNSLRRLFDLCAELRVPRFNMPPCLIQDNPEQVTQDADRWLLDQLPHLAEAAKDRGVTLLLEPVNKYESDHLHSVEHAARLTREIGHSHLKCTADFFHMQLEELDTPTALKNAGTEVSHIHVAENTRVEPGPGSLDFKPGFAILKKNGYAGIIEVECRFLSGDPTTVLPAAIRHLKQSWLTS
ncbi:MAG: sugar phosphate isomerase/epimerase [Limisphaerales bacterium]|jgi:sugar phosphate isomerase/epimerase